MGVLVLTIFISVMLALGFVVFFVHQAQNPARDDHRDSLLPFSDETPKGPDKPSDGKQEDRGYESGHKEDD
jgi:hypothetical protein